MAKAWRVTGVFDHMGWNHNLIQRKIRGIPDRPRMMRVDRSNNCTKWLILFLGVFHKTLHTTHFPSRRTVIPFHFQNQRSYGNPKHQSGFFQSNRHCSLVPQGNWLCSYTFALNPIAVNTTGCRQQTCVKLVPCWTTLGHGTERKFVN